ncbi:MAG: ABC transporter permease [Thermomicrobiales bacterium]|nr:ABC transporter permease [Thermomicrobiales bacterium]MCO5225247.1 ABC transporter permease [Thermomicrobiales bacterium]MCO5229027.1 ABC transporter permease [Thermomicrobiales bacterium]
MSPFTRYLVQKTGWFLLAFSVALILNFFLPRMIPGNPVDTIVSQMGQGGADSQSMQRVYENYMEEFGLNEPLHQQFFTYVGNVLRGDLGTSFSLYPASVNSLIGNALPWTLALQIPAILIGWIIGNLLGALAAYKGGWFDRVGFTGSLLLSSLPYYSFAILLLYVVAVRWDILPARGGYSTGWVPAWSWAFFQNALNHFWLPFLSLVLVFIGGQAIGMRSMAIYELGADYVDYSRGLGVPDSKITRYIFRNAMLPQITGLALSIGGLVSGALVTENVFSYPGIGSLLFTSIRRNDYPVIQAITLLIMVGVLMANFIVDILYGVIDPRIRAAQTGS